MLRRLAAILVAGLLPAGSGAAEAAAMVKERPPTPAAGLRPPRHPDIAVQEELDAARRAGTLAAYDLFLARHGEHRFAEAARRERARIAASAGH